MATKLKAIPLSRAKTGWELCLDVIKAIKTEPKRINMNCYITKVDPNVPNSNAPACGTVGCFAGWITILRGRPDMDNADFSSEEILGPDVNYYTVKGDQYVFNMGWGDRCNHFEPGTKGHMHAVVRRIEKFMRINQKALKARKLTPITR